MLLLDSVKAPQSSFAKPDVLPLDKLIASHQIVTLDHHVAHRAIVAGLNARAAFGVQRVKWNVSVFGGRIETTGN